ncbi:carbohydrate ABC transporter permease [Fimbriimonas ginsengisoli]|uniref:N-Acetyl-D-glucosamine ABC transport system, permease protein 2 n=1 Tax=Fimbriimonas ginsengisoli Gsoil 348 TaxID=661478 RepID=A0A068NVJ0_FIMGI|nr:carbohydrate ABC transporter permease [Fimbriimonas ginsengisoli]AIE85574.1 N-Acetyl-D-glucosamine ABC transport system, permease protein 2 [Fimbriimonas ginsengisoli Gsoil 348]
MKKASFSRVVGQAATALAAIMMVAPVVWMLSTAFKPEHDVLIPKPQWVPEHATFQNFRNLFAKAEEFPILRWFFNSLGIALVVTLLVLAVTSMAAFALARIEFKGRNALFILIVATMIIPNQVMLIPVFLIVTQLGLFNSYLGIILPGLASAFGVFLLRQFFLTIPAELEEAAFLDGAGLWTIYSRVIMPLSKPALATLAIFTFMGSWNSFEWPLIVTNDIDMRTLPVGLSIFQGRYNLEYGLTMASAVIITVPMLIAFLIFQRRITEGIALTGLK